VDSSSNASARMPPARAEQILARYHEHAEPFNLVS
jgi:hypothetical protein